MGGFQHREFAGAGGGVETEKAGEPGLVEPEFVCSLASFLEDRTKNRVVVRELKLNPIGEFEFFGEFGLVGFWSGDRVSTDGRSSIRRGEFVETLAEVRALDLVFRRVPE